MQAASESLKKFEKSYKDNIYTPVSILGFTWLPEIVLKGKINNLSSVMGSGVWLFGFLISGQLFGLKGITLHSTLYGGGMAVTSLFTLMN
jgi:hypothetical protein